MLPTRVIEKISTLTHKIVCTFGNSIRYFAGIAPHGGISIGFQINDNDFAIVTFYKFFPFKRIDLQIGDKYKSPIFMTDKKLISTLRSMQNG